MGAIYMNGICFGMSETDINGTGDKFQPVIYSTEEREIGVWTNGKPLYQKTMRCTAGTSIGPNDWATIPWDDEPSDIDFLVTGQNHQGDVPNSYATIRAAYTGGHVKIAAIYSSTFGANAQFTIWYTKTTDQPGSGTWTPQGVPAVHYSEDEHVVGTWIDGSTLYEKTINVGTISTSTTVAHGINNLDIIIDYSGFGKYAGTNKTIIPFQNPASGYGLGINTYDETNLVLAKSSSLGSNVSDCYITIRYTKSSS